MESDEQNRCKFLLGTRRRVVGPNPGVNKVCNPKWNIFKVSRVSQTALPKDLTHLSIFAGLKWLFINTLANTRPELIVIKDYFLVRCYDLPLIAIMMTHKNTKFRQVS